MNWKSSNNTNTTCLNNAAVPFVTFVLFVVLDSRLFCAAFVFESLMISFSLCLFSFFVLH
jgi:hypothetical protein